MILERHRDFFNNIDWNRVRSVKKLFIEGRGGNFSNSAKMESKVAEVTGGDWVGDKPWADGWDVQEVWIESTQEFLKLECKLHTNTKKSCFRKRSGNLAIPVINGSGNNRENDFGEIIWPCDYFIFWNCVKDDFYVWHRDLFKGNLDYLKRSSKVYTSIPGEKLTLIDYYKIDLEPYSERGYDKIREIEEDWDEDLQREIEFYFKTK